MNIIIVGAGVVGCAIAYELAARGARVRLIDPRGAGLGATRASAGMLAPYVEGHHPSLLTLCVRSLGLYDDFVQRVVDDSGHSIEYEREGTLQVAIHPHEAGELCSAARALAASGVAHALLDGGEVRRLEPQLPELVTRALLIRDHGYVAAAPLTQALAAAAAFRGVVQSAAHVHAIAGGAAPGVVTADGMVHGDAVIVAAGSWSSTLAAPESDAVRPIRGQLLQLRVPGRPASRVIWGSRCYLVPWRDGTVLVGATVEDVGFDETATADGVQHLLAASLELLPALRTAAFEEVRVGLRPMTGDELPVIGPSSTRRQVFYATGHYRNGVLLAPLTATLIADLVLDGRQGPDLALVRPARLGL